MEISELALSFRTLKMVRNDKFYFAKTRPCILRDLEKVIISIFIIFLFILSFSVETTVNKI